MPRLIIKGFFGYAPAILDQFVCFLIIRYGPLRQQWTMRFEAKHSYFKKLTQHIGNFINLPYTLAIRHEKFQCYYRMDTEKYQRHIVDIGPSTFMIGMSFI
jgi:hypothetical protein